jgi:glycosyltransferase involved in cell wall biosynthesis
VLVPAYNGERFVGEALASLAAQTFGDFEAIVVDDGSTDRTAAIVAELAARDPGSV